MTLYPPMIPVGPLRGKKIPRGVGVPQSTGLSIPLPPHADESEVTHHQCLELPCGFLPNTLHVTCSSAETGTLRQRSSDTQQTNRDTVVFDLPHPLQ